MAKNPNFYPVILAGGRGTRFWPLSRKRRAKQLLPLDGKQTMIQQTVERLLPLAPAKKFWIITNDDLRPAILQQLPKLPKTQILAEPVGRNTAPAIGLAAFLLLRERSQRGDRYVSLRSRHRATRSAIAKRIERGSRNRRSGREHRRDRHPAHSR